MIILTEEYKKRVIEENVFFDCLNLKTNAGSQVRRAKAFLIYLKGHKCQICKNTHWLDSLIPLTFDHIDGNSDNWKLDNCQLVCKNCDALQPTYCGRNIGKNKNTIRNNYRINRYNNGLKP